MTDNKKLYYINPLKAAWMLKEFDVKCYMGDIDNDDYDMYESFMPLMLLEDYNYREKHPDNFIKWDKKIYIHPDSHHIFEPMEGDLITDSNKKTYGLMNEHDSILVPERHNGKRFFILNSDRKIIQRNNTAFFMPEVE